MEIEFKIGIVILALIILIGPTYCALRDLVKCIISIIKNK